MARGGVAAICVAAPTMTHRVAGETGKDDVGGGGDGQSAIWVSMELPPILAPMLDIWGTLGTVQ